MPMPRTIPGRNSALGFQLSALGTQHPFSGFTLVELIIVIVLLALAFSGLASISESMRNQAKTEQARALLRTLAIATDTYAENQDPPGTCPPGAPYASSVPALQALLAFPQSRSILAGLEWPWNTRLDAPHRWKDPWGRELRYITMQYDREAVRMNGSKPFWVCAGPDGRFGEQDATRRADNISTDEPM